MPFTALSVVFPTPKKDKGGWVQHILTYSLTPWYRILFEKLIVTQLVKKYPFLWNLKVHYCVHKSQPLDCILSQLNPVCLIIP
jgi:hypothetical protein